MLVYNVTYRNVARQHIILENRNCVSYVVCACNNNGSVFSVVGSVQSGYKTGEFRSVQCSAVQNS
jgi:hypothetical protein